MTATLTDPTAVRRVRDHAISDALTAQVAETFKALGNPARIRILHALLHGELCVGDLSALLTLSVSAVSHHLQRLRAMRIVRFRRVGKLIYYALDDEHVTHLIRVGLEHADHE